MQDSSVRRFFDTLISLSFVSPLLLGAGCGESESDIPYAGLPSCPSSAWCEDVARLSPARAVDYIELRSASQPQARDARGCVVTSAGSACSGAADAAEQAQALASQMEQELWRRG